MEPTESAVHGYVFGLPVAARATEILGRAARPGVDFAISEAVHCKSKGESENGRAVTRSATPVCSETYTMRIIRASAAKVVCLMGDVPGAEFRRLLNAEKAVRFLGPLNVQAQERYFVFLDHPAGRGSNQDDSGRVERRTNRTTLRSGEIEATLL